MEGAAKDTTTVASMQAAASFPGTDIPQSDVTRVTPAFLPIENKTFEYNGNTTTSKHE